MATSLNVWFDIDEPAKVVAINVMEMGERQGKIVSDAITFFDNDLYNCVFPTDQPEFIEDEIMGGPSGDIPTGEYNRYVYVPVDAYVETKDQNDLDALELQRAKDDQKSLIKQGFEDEPSSGLVVTLSVGDVKVDCYRSNQDDFKQANEKAVRDGATEVVIRDYDNGYHTVTPTDCSTIYVAIQEFGIATYDKKWNKQSLIDDCTTIEEVEAITWDSVDS